MSAIAGIFRFGGAPAGLDEICRLTAAMAHGGSDAQQQWARGSVALGHCLLRVNANSRDESQPVVSSDGTHTLVMDGRIDNRPEVLRALGAAGETPRNDTDPELVLCAYRAWGSKAPTRLLGDFAFAIWNERDQSLFLARDHIGARWVHYWRNEYLFAFATDPEALLALDEIEFAPNEARIASVLIPDCLHFDPEEGWIRDIYILPPGSSLILQSDGKLTKSRFWQLREVAEVRLDNDSEYDEAFRDVFLQAVECRMQVIHPPALMLSGGLDSLAVLGAARELEKHGRAPRLYTYSLVSQDECCGESSAIRRVSVGYEESSHHVIVDSDWDEFQFEDLRRAMWDKAHPVDCSIATAQWLAQIAARAGHRALLSGVSGDLTLSTPTWYMAEHLKTGQFALALNEARLASMHNTYLQGLGIPKLAAVVLRRWLASTGPGRSWRSWRAGHRDPTAAYRHRFPHHVLEQIQQSHFEATRSQIDSERGPPSREHVHALETGSLRCGLEGYGQTSFRHGIDHLDPWSDRRLIAFCLTLPTKQRSGAGWTKLIARRACSEWLPRGVLWHSGKVHLGWHLREPSTGQTSTCADYAYATKFDLTSDSSMCPNVEVIRQRNHPLPMNDDGYSKAALLAWLRRMRYRWRG